MMEWLCLKVEPDGSVDEIALARGPVALLNVFKQGYSFQTEQQSEIHDLEIGTYEIYVRKIER